MKSLKEQCRERKEEREMERKKKSTGIARIALNPKCAYYQSQRNKRVKLATPIWRSKSAMWDIGIDAYNKTKKTGIRHVVDHIVPLAHDLVCGLNCEFNLQVITEMENLKKGNRFTV